MAYEMAYEIAYENMKKEILKEETDRLNKSLLEVETTTDIKEIMHRYGKDYKINPKEKLIAHIKRKSETRIKQQFNKLDTVAASEDLQHDLIITVEWKPSRMWRSNPRVHTNYGFVGSSIGGCGYDKKSTATAEALNNFNPILKKLYDAKEKILSNPLPLYESDYEGNNIKKGDVMSTHDATRKLIGYGSGYGIIPSFEGGVGVDCHLSILRNLGFDAEYIVNTPNTDVFRIANKKEC